jgi:hypothetical protein
LDFLASDQQEPRHFDKFNTRDPAPAVRFQRPAENAMAPARAHNPPRQPPSIAPIRPASRVSVQQAKQSRSTAYAEMMREEDDVIKLNFLDAGSARPLTATAFSWSKTWTLVRLGLPLPNAATKQSVSTSSPHPFRLLSDAF